MRALAVVAADRGQEDVDAEREWAAAALGPPKLFACSRRARASTAGNHCAAWGHEQDRRAASRRHRRRRTEWPERWRCSRRSDRAARRPEWRIGLRVESRLSGRSRPHRRRRTARSSSRRARAGLRRCPPRGSRLPLPHPRRAGRADRSQRARRWRIGTSTNRLWVAAAKRACRERPRRSCEPADPAIGRRPARGRGEDEAGPVPEVQRVGDATDVAERREREEHGDSRRAGRRSPQRSRQRCPGRGNRGDSGNSVIGAWARRRCDLPSQARPRRLRSPRCAGSRGKGRASRAMPAPTANSQTRVVIAKYAIAGWAGVATSE